MPTTRIFLIRHGETEWNRDARIQGHRDIPLNEIGRQQARLLVGRLGGQGIQAVYASDLSRALDTARIALEGLGLEIRATSDLREASFGAWEGMGWNQVETEFPEEVARYRREFGTYAPPGGESLAQVRERAVRAFDRISAENPGATLSIFSHGGPCRAILSKILGMEVRGSRRLGMSNASVHIVEREGKESRVTLLNDTGHLSGECAPLSVFQTRTPEE